MAEPESREDGFEIEGKTYPVPTLDTFDLAEARILKRYCNVVLEDFSPVHPEAEDSVREAHEARQREMLSDPDFKAAFAHIAYRRGNPEQEFEEIQAVVDKLGLLDVTLALFEEEDANPPEETGSPSEPESENGSSEEWKLPDSGILSPAGSDLQATTLPNIGTTESGTSSPVSLVETSAS